jgi:hypothetical protein
MTSFARKPYSIGCILSQTLRSALFARVPKDDGSSLAHPSRRGGSQVYAGCVRLPTWPLLRMRPRNQERAEPARSWSPLSTSRNYAACLCIAPVADELPRIALTERSIAAHSRPISAAARPSA